MSDDKIIGLPAAKDEFRGAVETMKRNLPAMLDHVALMAKIKRSAFLAYVEEGFTEAQALELCKGSVL